MQKTYIKGVKDAKIYLENLNIEAVSIESKLAIEVIQKIESQAINILENDSYKVIIFDKSRNDYESGISDTLSQHYHSLFEKNKLDKSSLINKLQSSKYVRSDFSVKHDYENGLSDAKKYLDNYISTPTNSMQEYLSEDKIIRLDVISTAILENIDSIISESCDEKQQNQYDTGAYSVLSAHYLFNHSNNSDKNREIYDSIQNRKAKIGYQVIPVEEPAQHQQEAIATNPGGGTPLSNVPSSKEVLNHTDAQNSHDLPILNTSLLAEILRSDDDGEKARKTLSELLQKSQANTIKKASFSDTRSSIEPVTKRQKLDKEQGSSREGR